MVKAIGVFCSAAEGIDKAYFDAAREVGSWMARRGIALVYGGARMGLMEATARAAKEAGGNVVGVVPERLYARGAVSEMITEAIPCTTLAERKEIMIARSDLLLALPGGIGTVDEVFHTMGSATIGEHRKRVVLYNVNGFWDECMRMLQGMEQKGFIRGKVSDYVVMAGSIEELEESMLNEEQRMAVCAR